MTIDKYPEVELEILQKRVRELELENIKYRKTLEDNDLLDSTSNVSDAETICIKEIKLLREISDKGSGLTMEDAKILDILHKNLLMARGQYKEKKEDKNKKSGPKEVAELLKIVQDKK